MSKFAMEKCKTRRQMNSPDTHKMQCVLKCNWKEGNARNLIE